MDREANLPVPPAQPASNLVLPLSNPDTSSSRSSSSSPPGIFRNVQAAFKRHRPLGIVQTNNMKPRRMVVPQREVSRSSGLILVPNNTNKSQDCVSSSHDNMKESVFQTKDVASVVTGESQEVASITPPSFPGIITKTFDVQRNQEKLVSDCKEKNPLPSSHVESQHIDAQRKVQFLSGQNAAFQGADDRVATGLENLSSHMGSLALTEMDWDVGNRVDTSTVVNNDSKQRHMQNMESEISYKSDGMASSLAKRTNIVQDQLHQLKNFLSQPVTQSSVVGSSCPTTTSIHSASAPMLNLTTYCSQTCQAGNSHAVRDPQENPNVNHQPISQGDMKQLSVPALKDTSGMLIDQKSAAALTSTSAINTQVEIKDFDLSKEQQGSTAKGNELPKDPCPPYDKSIGGKGAAGDVINVQPQAPSLKSDPSDVKLESFKQERQEKVPTVKGASVHRKRNYDPDLFFKVNGKLYQRLGKIGSGGSSEVHKVISSDCTIYALKKIKLKGRDYATAYGFCQEIEYLNRLKGKDNIIQLVDYEVTDKNLLQEVLNGSTSNKDGRVKDDGYIYMVLEYGEIDLAHMLSQKWKQMDGSNQTIDENWLRFYWQQILQAVNTIHEERIVHSDLKPANFLLVKGSLKLIDFGIAKAIMSDTTNIQRDAQVGTLSYMSPEAFLCNETDSNGNIIKCGRPSDIWSLGCILYQMVYGRTPFAEYKTFWSKFKVITDPNHQIPYEPVSNPWLLDIMKKCLAWDRNERWRIPQLLQHPFLVPPVPSQPSLIQDQSFQLLQLIAESCTDDQEASVLYTQLSQLLRNPVSQIAFQPLTSREQQCKLLSQMSKLCFHLKERLGKLT